MNKNFASISLTFVVLLWGLSFSLTKPLLSYMGIFNFLAYRFVIGGLLLAIYLYIRNIYNSKSVNRSNRNQSKQPVITTKLLRDGLLAGLMFFAAFSLQTLGLKHTTIAKNAFIVGSCVIFIPFVKIAVFKTKQTVSVWLQVALATGGLAMITLSGPSGMLNFGDMVTLLGTVIFAYYTIYIEQKIKSHETIAFTTVQLLSVGFLSLFSMMLFETPTLPQTSFHWVSVIVMGIFLTGFAYIVSNASQGVIPALNVTIIYTLEPFFASLFGWMLLSEAISANTVLGAVLIFLSMLTPALMNQNRRKTAQSLT